MNKVDIRKVDIRNVQIIIGILIIAIVNLWNIQSLHSITIIDDEFGYVGVAAQMAGYDWTNLLSTSNYYSYGYGLLLSLLFRAGFGSTAFFKAAIVLNVVFLILSFLIICYFTKKMINNKYDILVALAIALYSCNIFQVKLSWSESILYFLTWLLIFLLYQLSVKFQFKYLLAIVFTSVYMYTVHQRCLSVVIASVIMIGVILLNGNFNKKNVCKAAAAMLVLLFLLILAGILKEWVIANCYLAGSVSDKRIAVNDYSGQTNKIKRLLDPRVLASVLLGTAGKLWGQSAASGMLVLIALTATVWKVFRKGIFRLKTEEIFSVSAVILFLGALGIATLYHAKSLSGYYYYTIIMTRYIDYAAGPMLLLGFMILFRYKDHLKEILTSVCIMAVITLSTYYAFTKTQRTLMVNVNLASIYPIIGNLSGGLQRVIFVGLGTILFVVIVLGMIKLGDLKNKTNTMISIVLIGILLMWSYNGIKMSVGFTNYKQAEVEEYAFPVMEYVESIGYDKPLYYVTVVNEGTGGSYNFLKILQFLLPEQKIELIADDEIEGVTENGDILILADSNDYEEFDLSGIEEGLLLDTGRLRLYTVNKTQR